MTDKEIVSKDNCLEVYGIVSGQPGWTEEYNWIHKGKWVESITNYLDNLKFEIDLHYKKVEEDKKLREVEIKKQIESTVDKFNKMFA